MDLSLWATLLALMPAAALLLSYPRRLPAAVSILCAALVLWIELFSGLETLGDGFRWFLGGIFGVLGCAYAIYVLRRGLKNYRSWNTGLREKLRRKAELAQKLAEVKAKGVKTEQEQKEALAIYSMVKSLSSALSWNDVRPRLQQAVEQYLGLEEFALFVSDLHSQQSMRPLVTRRLFGSVGSTWATLQYALQRDHVPENQPQILQMPEPCIGVPLFYEREPMGYFFARLPRGAQPEELLNKAIAFGEEISFVLRRVKLFQEVDRLSQIDGLTGVYRRDVLDERLKEETLRAKTFKTTYCLMLLDIDHFKRLNDSYGHLFGDSILKRMGEILKSCIYETDFVARYGGEEFAVLLPRGEPAGVLRKAEQIRQRVEGEPFRLAIETLHTSVSIGVAHFPRDGATVEEVVASADKALYEAKSLGRNKIVDFSEVGEGKGS